MRLIAAYHRPGDPAARSLVEEIAARASDAAGAEIEAMELEEAAEACRSGGARVYALLPLRGGHWASLAEACGAAPTPPPSLLAAALAEKLHSLSARKPLLVALAPRRLRRVHAADAAALLAALRAHGLEPRLELVEKPGDEPRGGGDAVAPLALLPGRLASAAERHAGSIGAAYTGPIAAYASPHLSAWLASEAARALEEK